jgi:heme/copper-type cytochrome/quinol oxidase subunit 3
MQVLSIIIAILTIILLLSSFLCGLWIKAKKISDKASLKFHMQLGISSVAFGLATAVLLLIQVN